MLETVLSIAVKWSTHITQIHCPYKNLTILSARSNATWIGRSLRVPATYLCQWPEHPVSLHSQKKKKIIIIIIIIILIQIKSTKAFHNSEKGFNLALLPRSNITECGWVYTALILLILPGVWLQNSNYVIE